MLLARTQYVEQKLSLSILQFMTTGGLELDIQQALDEVIAA